MRLYRTSADWLVETDDGSARALPGFDFDAWLASTDPAADLRALAATASAAAAPVPAAPLMPIGTQEIWAVGVTYQRSKVARMEESQNAKSAYDLVYDAPRPELFFKATPSRTRGPGQPVTLRHDTKWIVPEPELALVISSRGKLVGYTIGNDMSCRDIEGENLLYLPQAKTWNGCCALGPCILLAGDGADVRASEIRITITRDGSAAFTGSVQVSQIKRTFEELIGYLFRDQSFPGGVILLTGTGIVPPNEFSLRSGDGIRIEIDGIGTLENPVA
ncbi:MAG TPA: fumarylacetoacetate hydrolase family protein [Tepidisphaeraceae bacterium]|nr:fumarylacetoacetate hydrolase family protein [Tepidisphaeraceae bacterium]